MCLSQSTRSFLPGQGEAGVPLELTRRRQGLYLSRGSTAQPDRRGQHCAAWTARFSVATAALNTLGLFSDAGCPDRATQVKWPSSKLGTSVFR